MAFSDRVEVILDVVAEKANAGLKGFRQSISEADGVTGKFKAAAGGAFDYAKDHAGQLAMAGGAALVAFGVKAVGAFTDLAKASIDGAAATAMSVEEFSRWAAVADDFGISSEQLAGGVGKIAKSLDDAKWAKYGIETRDAAGQARSANEILIDSLSTLSAISNETERVRVGNELFGKGYASLAPLVGRTADEYRDMLGAVESGQVITEKEAAKAERMRLAQDALQDALQEVTLAVGGFVAEMAPMIETVAEGVTELSALADKIGLVTAAASMSNPISAFQAANEALTDSIKLQGTSLIELQVWMEKNGVSAQDQAKFIALWEEENRKFASSVDETGRALAGGEQHMKDLGRAAGEAEQATADLGAAGVSHLGDLERAASNTESAVSNLDAAISGVRDKLSESAAWREANQAMWDLAVAMQDPNKSMSDLAGMSDTAALKMLSIVETSEKIPRDIKSEIVTLIDEGKLAEALTLLGKFEEGVDVPVRFKATGGDMPTVKRFASGTPAGGAPGGPSLVGEEGPELVDLPKGAVVHTAQETRDLLRQAAARRGGQGSVTVNQYGPVNNGVGVEALARRIMFEWSAA